MKRTARLVSFIVGLTMFFTAIVPANAFFPIEIIIPIITHPIYVDGVNGNDTDPGHIPGEALKTITEAVDRANTGGWDNYQILVTGGDYTAETTPLDFNKDISIYGGYNNGFADRDPESNPTEIEGGGDNTINITGHSGTLSGFKIYNQTAGMGVINIDNSGGTNQSININAVEIDNSTAFAGGIYAILGAGDNLTVDSNYLHDLSNFGGAMVIEGSPNSSRVTNNFLYNNSGLSGISVENTTLYNNIVSKGNGNGLYLRDGAIAYHNTVVDNLTGISVPGGVVGVEFYNNLLADNSTAGLTLNSSPAYDYNAYWNNGTIITAAHDVECDPGLSYTSNPNDYQLDPTSECIDKGTEITAVTNDYFGEPRKKDGDGDAIYASDPGAHEADGDTATAPVITNDDASPNVFSPDGDSINDTTTVSYDLNTTSDVVVEIYQGSDIIKELTNEVQGSGTHNVIWDGTDSVSDPVDEGNYGYRIIADNSEGNDEVTGTVIVDFAAAPPTGCAGFPDIDVTDAICPAVQYVKDEGIFQGYPDGTFRPNNVINRVETTKVILEGFSIPLLADDGTNLGYPDVIIGEWYMTYLRTAQDEGVATGYPDGTFRPNQQVVRVEMLKIFFETSGVDLSGVTYATPPYPDTPISAETLWYLVYVQFSKDHALVDTDPSGNFNPAEGMKRGDVATLFYRFHQEGYI